MIKSAASTASLEGFPSKAAGRLDEQSLQSACSHENHIMQTGQSWNQQLLSVSESIESAWMSSLAWQQESRHARSGGIAEANVRSNKLSFRIIVSDVETSFCSKQFLELVDLTSVRFCSETCGVGLRPC